MNDNTGVSVFWVIVITVLFFAIYPVVNGWVITILWGWFVVPLFGLPRLSIPVAVGLVLVIQLMTPQPDYTAYIKKFKDEGNDIWVTLGGEMVGNILGRTAAALTLGWVVHLFM